MGLNPTLEAALEADLGAATGLYPWRGLEAIGLEGMGLGAAGLATGTLVAGAGRLTGLGGATLTTPDEAAGVLHAGVTVGAGEAEAAEAVVSLAGSAEGWVEGEVIMTIS